MCNGNKVVEARGSEICSVCKGDGVTYPFKLGIAETCEKCGGSGYS
jgi:DnaJ-class molecular chaperone